MSTATLMTGSSWMWASAAVGRYFSRTILIWALIRISAIAIRIILRIIGTWRSLTGHIASRTPSITKAMGRIVGGSLLAMARSDMARMLLICRTTTEP